MKSFLKLEYCFPSETTRRQHAVQMAQNLSWGVEKEKKNYE